MVMQELEHLRAEIDAIDTEILRLLAKRQSVVTHVGEFKQKNRIQVFDAAREEYLHQFHYQLSVKFNLSFDFIKALFEMIMAESRRTQQQIDKID